jgi:hypothetical protein
MVGLIQIRRLCSFALVPPLNLRLVAQRTTRRMSRWKGTLAARAALATRPTSPHHGTGWALHHRHRRHWSITAPTTCCQAQCSRCGRRAPEVGLAIGAQCIRSWLLAQPPLIPSLAPQLSAVNECWCASINPCKHQPFARAGCCRPHAAPHVRPLHAFCAAHVGYLCRPVGHRWALHCAKPVLRPVHPLHGECLPGGGWLSWSGVPSRPCPHHHTTPRPHRHLMHSVCLAPCVHSVCAWLAYWGSEPLYQHDKAGLLASLRLAF